MLRAVAGSSSGGTPGGSDTQVQFNDSSAFGGDAGLTYNKTTNVLTNAGGQLSLAGGTVTTSTPLIDASQTWNAAVTFTGFKLNVTDTSSNSGSLFIDFQVASSSKFSINKSGGVTAQNFTGTAGGNPWTTISDGAIAVKAAQAIQWSSTASASGSTDLVISRIGAGILRARGASSAAACLSLATYTVATLPAAATVGAGAVAFVSDANATTARSTVAGGGSNFVMVMCDGTNWLIVA